MTLFDRLVDEALNNKPEFSPLRIVVEKEILHSDILREMSLAGLLNKLTFIGGTCLRACYDSNRLSEDLDFTGGSEFTKETLSDLSSVLKKNLQIKYGLSVDVIDPSKETGNVDTWKIKIIIRPNLKNMPMQRINIDICAIPSYDRKFSTLKNHYGIDMGTSTLLIPVQSKEEILADKIIALAFRRGRIKHRDLWDITWLNQQQVVCPTKLVKLKIFDHNQTVKTFVKQLTERLELIRNDQKTKNDFYKEMVRFVPANIAKNSLDKEDFWPYLSHVVVSESQKQINDLQGDGISQSPFSM